MVLARLRRHAWALVLVLIAGLAQLSSHHPAHAPTSAAHGHHASLRDGVPDMAQVAASDPGAKPQHCPRCLTADCALSCNGAAVLAALIEWMPSSTAASWIAFPATAPPGVVPAGDIDPPRPLLIV